MVAKFVVFIAMFAAAAASDFSQFAYSVADPHTGDFKNQIEARAGNNVQGQYSLLESDGTRRTVDYAAGAQGFNAVVRKDPAFIAQPILRSPVIAQPILRSPILAQPILRSPILEQPILRSPILAQPILRSPILAQPILRSPILAQPILRSPILPVGPAPHDPIFRIQPFPYPIAH